MNFGQVSELIWYIFELVTSGYYCGLSILNCSDFLFLPETISYCFFFVQYMCVKNSTI